MAKIKVLAWLGFSAGLGEEFASKLIYVVGTIESSTLWL